MKQLQPLLAALLLALCASAAWAERTPPRALPLGDDGNTRVIVKFKPAAPLLRAHALSATDHAATALALGRRAGVLGARVGLVLKAGASVNENVQVVQAEGVNARALAARLALDPDVEYAEVDRRVRRLRVPNDPRFASVSGNGPAVGQWYLRAPAGEVAASIDAVSAWDTTTGSASIVVAVVDTGVRTNHPDLAGKLLPGYDMISDAAIANDGDGRDSDASDSGDWLTQAEIDADAAAHPTNPTFSGCTPSDSSWHGTQVAGIIGAATDNGIGMAGAGWNVRVLPVRVLGKCFGYTSDILDGMRWAAGLHVPGVPDNPNPARVINLSLGSSDACSTLERDTIAELNAAGVVVVAAAGNSEGLAAGSPANCPGVIGVSALRHVGSKVGFSDVGPEISIAAPGGNCVNASGACLYPILTTADNGTKAPLSPIYTDSFNPSLGTSFSSPLVSATAALMLSVQPTLTPDAVRAAIRASARPFPSSGLPPDAVTGALVACHAPNGIVQDQCYCTTTTCGAGMLDAGAAVRAALCVKPGDRGVAVRTGARAGTCAFELRLDTGARAQHRCLAMVVGRRRQHGQRVCRQHCGCGSDLADGDVRNRHRATRGHRRPGCGHDSAAEHHRRQGRCARAARTVGWWRRRCPVVALAVGVAAGRGGAGTCCGRAGRVEPVAAGQGHRLCRDTAALQRRGDRGGADRRAATGCGAPRSGQR